MAGSVMKSVIPEPGSKRLVNTVTGEVDEDVKESSG